MKHHQQRPLHPQLHLTIWMSWKLLYHLWEIINIVLLRQSISDSTMRRIFPDNQSTLVNASTIKHAKICWNELDRDDSDCEKALCASAASHGHFYQRCNTCVQSVVPGMWKPVPKPPNMVTSKYCYGVAKIFVHGMKVPVRGPPKMIIWFYCNGAVWTDVPGMPIPVQPPPNMVTCSYCNGATRTIVRGMTTLVKMPPKVVTWMYCSGAEKIVVHGVGGPWRWPFRGGGTFKRGAMVLRKWLPLGGLDLSSGGRKWSLEDIAVLSRKWLSVG